MFCSHVKAALDGWSEVAELGQYGRILPGPWRRSAASWARPRPATRAPSSTSRARSPPSNRSATPTVSGS